MKLTTTMMSAFAVLMSLSGTASAQGIVETVEQGCATEITTYCSQVSPGEGRLLACFYAHEDKLSGQCQYALYSASAQLDQAVSALDYLATQCRDDILKLCADVQIGEGRVLECLKSNSASVSAACNQAVSDVAE
jgi:Cysteine rich repeat